LHDEPAHVAGVVDTFEVDDALSWGDNRIVGRIIGARRKHTFAAEEGGGKHPIK